MKSLLVLSIFFLFCGCVSQQKRLDEIERNRMQEVQEKSEITNAEKLFQQGAFDKALIQFRSFSNTKPSSKYWAQAKLGEADVLQELGKKDEALALLRNLRDLSLKDNPPVAALASYKMSFIYEEKGDEQKTLASLLESHALSDSLPEEIALAEIPARLAVQYSRMGKHKEALQWLEKADRGLKKSVEVLGFNREWVSKTYYQMGRVSTLQMDADNFFSTIEALRIVQVYHLKSLKLDDPRWSPRSLAALKENYSLLFGQLKKMNEDVRSSAENKTRAGAALTSLLVDAELYKPLKDVATPQTENDFYSYVDKMKNKIRIIAFKTDAGMGLTTEAKERNSLKKNLNFEDPEAYLPRAVPDSEDPNL